MKQPLLESALESLETALHARDKDDVRWHIEDAIDDLKEAISQIQGAREDAVRMAGRVKLDTELLDMLAPDELTFPQLLALHPTLERAFYRLELLDANGASATASDIQDAVVYGHLSAPDATRFADEITTACDMLERGADELPAMSRADFLDWTLEKNGLAEAMEELADGEAPTVAMQKAINEREAN